MELHEEFNDLFAYDPNVLKTTSKSEYLDTAALFWKTFGPSFEAFGLRAIASDGSWGEEIMKLSSCILESAQAHLPKTIFKSKRNMQNMDDALYMVTFVFPALVSYNDPAIGVSPSSLPDDIDVRKISDFFKEAATVLATSWSEKFGGKPLGIATTLEISNAYEEHILRKSFARFRK